MPQTTIITPNSLEARRLAIEDGEEDDGPDLAECARRMIASGCEYVLVTGTHENTPQVVNTLYGQDGVVRSRQLAAPARLLSRLRLHARLRDRRDDRQRPRDRRRGEGRAGIHVADAEGGVPPRHGPAHSRPPVLGARGRSRRTKAAGAR